MLVIEVIIALTILIYFVQSPVLNEGYENQYIVETDGIIYRCGETNPYTGKVLDTLSNNMILEFDVINGLKNGVFLISTLNGVLTTKGFIENNRNVGTWQYFYENGELESVGEFYNDKPNGKWIWYYKNGIKKSEGIYVSGKQEGKWLHFDKSGKLIKVSYYLSGEEITKTESGKQFII